MRIFFSLKSFLFQFPETSFFTWYQSKILFDFLSFLLLPKRFQSSILFFLFCLKFQSFMASDSTTNQAQSSNQSVPSTSTTMADESANNPYFLPATKSPGIVLTSQPSTGLENYLSSARSMFLALSSQNKFEWFNSTTRSCLSTVQFLEQV